jgi:hypothetical protein
MFSQATTISKIESEVKSMLATIKGKSFELPVYLDFETDAQKYLSKSAMTAIAVRGCEMIEAAGYKGLHYVYGSVLNGTDGEATVDYVHTTDLGQTRYACVLYPLLKELCRQHGGA